MASVMELAGKDNAPETFRFVVVTLVPTAAPKVMLVKLALVLVMLLVLILAGEKLVAARLVKKPLVEVTLVPVAVVKPKAPDKVPPVSNK